MSSWDQFDFAITHVRKDTDDQIQSIKGHVIEDGNVRDVPIELPTTKAIEYLGYEGNFCTARKENDELKPGEEVTVTDDTDPPSLKTLSDKEDLKDLPEY